MNLEIAQQREHALRLLDSVPEEKLTAAVGLLESLLDPVSRAIANAPYDDEPTTEEDIREIAAARAASAQGKLISHEEVLAEFGLTSADFERIGKTQLEAESAVR